MTEHEEACDLKRAHAERGIKLAALAMEPFDMPSEKLLLRLPHSLAAELRLVLRKTPTLTNQMNPQGLAPAARQMLLLSVADICAARVAAGMATNSITDLGTLETIAAIKARLKPSAAVPKKGSWGPIKAGMLLADARKLVIFVHGACNAEIGRQQRKWSAQPKRLINHRVCLPAEYLAGATAVGVVARILQADGRVRGDTLARDAALLAFDACVHARLGELHQLDVKDIRSRMVSGKSLLSVTLRMTKTGRDRIVPISDPRVIELVIPLLDADKNAPLFREEGKRLSYGSIAMVLERTSRLATGQPASANIIRRSASLRFDGKEVRVGRKLGQQGEKTAEDHYTPDCTELALKLLHAANKKSALAGAKIHNWRKQKSI